MTYIEEMEDYLLPDSQTIRECFMDDDVYDDVMGVFAPDLAGTRYKSGAFYGNNQYEGRNPGSTAISARAALTKVLSH